MVILTPGLLLVIAVLVFGGRVALAGQSVEAAAGEAARVASLARTQPEADGAAAAAAELSLSQQGLQCLSTEVVVDTSGFAVPVGTAASITATVTCVVELSDLAAPGFPGSRTVTATAVSVLDTYRERVSGFGDSEALSTPNSEAGL